jgi:hypothetical protein
MKRYLVPALPFALSLGLSLTTVGRTVGWQDSGYYLAAVRELGVLYPPGFVLYLISCKAWTLLLGFLDFTLAVHLFSSMCAAAAAAAIAVASRDLLRTQGPLFRVGSGGNDLAAAVSGCLAAAGFTFWSAALLAKGYALLYLILALLISRMIRADESGKGRDFTIVAALIGLAWAAHPSATNVGIALVLFVWAHRKTLGWKGIAWRAGVAAACAIGPSLLLPVFALREPATIFGHPTSPGEWVRYLAGARFTGLPGVFGIEGWRCANALKYLWEDFLGVGLAMAVLGLSRLAIANPKLLVGVAAWVIPAAVVATLFRIEGQQDFWLVAAWLPLHLAVAVGFAALPVRFAKAATAALGALGLAWAVAANGRAVSMRGYDLAEQYGRFHLEPLDPDAVLTLESDDALATVRYLQVVKGVRPDVTVVDAKRLELDWYVAHLKARHPWLRTEPVMSEWSAGLSLPPARRPVYLEVAPPGATNLMPVGPFLRWAPPGTPNEPREWPFPVAVEQARSRMGRERGIRLQRLPEGLVVEPEPYEYRWVALYVRAQGRQAQAAFARGDWGRAAELLESARAADPEHPALEVIHLLGVSHYLLGDFGRAEPLLKQSLRLGPSARQQIRACSYLSSICRRDGRTAEAMRWQEQAMGVVGADPALKREFEEHKIRPK